MKTLFQDADCQLLAGFSHGGDQRRETIFPVTLLRTLILFMRTRFSGLHLVLINSHGPTSQYQHVGKQGFTNVFQRNTNILSMTPGDIDHIEEYDLFFQIVILYTNDLFGGKQSSYKDSEECVNIYQHVYCLNKEGRQRLRNLISSRIRDEVERQYDNVYFTLIFSGIQLLTMVCQFCLYSKVNSLYMYMYALFYSLYFNVGHYRVLIEFPVLYTT